MIQLAIMVLLGFALAATPAMRGWRINAGTCAMSRCYATITLAVWPLGPGSPTAIDWNVKQMLVWPKFMFYHKLMSGNCGINRNCRRIQNRIRQNRIRQLYHVNQPFKPVLHFTRIVANRSVFLRSMGTRLELMILTQKRMLLYVTIRLKWKTAFKLLAK